MELVADAFVDAFGADRVRITITHTNFNAISYSVVLSPAEATAFADELAEFATPVEP